MTLPFLSGELKVCSPPKESRVGSTFQAKYDSELVFVKEIHIRYPCRFQRVLRQEFQFEPSQSPLFHFLLEISNFLSGPLTKTLHLALPMELIRIVFDYCQTLDLETLNNNVHKDSDHWYTTYLRAICTMIEESRFLQPIGMVMDKKKNNISIVFPWMPHSWTDLRRCGVREICLCRIAKAIQVLHHHRIIHGRLHPRNIRWDGKDDIFLMDFGLTPPAEEESAYEDFVSNNVSSENHVSWLSPERVYSNFLDFGEDVYAFGNMIHEFFTGISLWENNSEAQIFFVIHTRDRVENELSRAQKQGKVRGLEDLRVQCLRRNPEDRGSMAEIVEKLNKMDRNDVF